MFRGKLAVTSREGNIKKKKQALVVLDVLGIV